jgi:ABC-type transport system substrate-binding protein
MVSWLASAMLSSALLPNGACGPSLGYVPRSFPRDATLVNRAMEHTVLGQVLETLVDNDQEGNLRPGLARAWRILQEGRLIELELAPGRVFSDGAALTAHDVVATLDRHRSSQTSQSRDYLQNIEAVEAVGDVAVRIRLKRPHVAILKVLSRPHLGVQPKGRTFVEGGSEPIVGSGPYRLVKAGAGWTLVKNARYAGEERPKFACWRLVFADDVEAEAAGLELPSYVPIALDATAVAIEKHPGFDGGAYDISRQFHFTQSAAWWYPNGERFADRHAQARIMRAVHALVVKRVAALKRQRATGIVPVGVAGHLPVPIEIAPPKPEEVREVVTVKVAGTKAELADYFDGPERGQVEAEQRVRFVLHEVKPAALEAVRRLRPDVYLISWMGGFNDPEGFLPVLSTNLDINVSKDLGALNELLEKARSEQSWDERAALYRRFNEVMVRAHWMVPAWKYDVRSFLEESYRYERLVFRYTPKLSEIVPNPAHAER